MAIAVNEIGQMEDLIKIYDNAVSDDLCDQIIRRFDASQNTYQDQKVSPKKGRIILSPAGFTHTHRGQIPVSNEKLIATSWVMFNRFE